ncbi:Anaphase-promoting complex subunit 10, partial [Trichinella britovi]
LHLNMSEIHLRENVLNGNVESNRSTRIRREVKIRCTDRLPALLLTGKEYQDISDEAAWVVSSYKQGYGIMELRSPSFETYWQTSGTQPHLLTLYFRRLSLVSHLCIYLNAPVDDSYTPKKLSIRRGTQLCDLVENRIVHLEDQKGWAVIPLAVPKRNFISAFIIQIAILENNLNGRDSCIRQLRIFGPKDERKSEIDELNELLFSYYRNLCSFR